jgi:hypothetical protein
MCRLSLTYSRQSLADSGFSRNKAWVVDLDLALLNRANALDEVIECFVRLSRVNG